MASFPEMGVRAVVKDADKFFQTIGKMSTEVGGFDETGTLGGIDLVALGGAAGLTKDAVTGIVAGLGTAVTTAAAVAAGIVIIGATAISAYQDFLAEVTPAADVQARFGAIAEKAGGSLEQMSAKLEEATRNQIPLIEAQKEFNQIVTAKDFETGLAFIELLPDLLDAAAAAGIEPSKAMEDLSAALIAGNASRLAAYGIAVDQKEVEAGLAEQLGVEVKDLEDAAKETAMLAALREELATKTADLTPIEETFAGQQRDVQIQMDNLIQQMKLDMFPALFELWQLLKPLVTDILIPFLKDTLPLAGPAMSLMLTPLKGIAVLVSGAFWEKFANVWMPAIIDRFLEFADVVGVKVMEAIEGLKGILDKARGWLSSLIPEWLIPHSPSPFEVSLEGVKQSLKEVGQLTGSLAPMQVAPVMAGMGGGMTTNNAFNLAVNSNAPVEPVVADFRMMQALARRR